MEVCRLEESGDAERRSCPTLIVEVTQRRRLPSKGDA
jgi:hypothetical protein